MHHSVKSLCFLWGRLQVSLEDLLNVQHPAPELYCHCSSTHQLEGGIMLDVIILHSNPIMLLNIYYKNLSIEYAVSAVPNLFCLTERFHVGQYCRSSCRVPQKKLWTGTSACNWEWIPSLFKIIYFSEKVKCRPVVGDHCTIWSKKKSR